MIVAEIGGLLDALAVSSETGKIASADHCSIRYQCWSPENPLGAVLLIHGRGGFLEKYLPVVIQLLQRHLQVVSFDWRGQGLSDRLVDSGAGHVADFADYVNDLELVADQFFRANSLKSVHPRRFLLAHSMGAHVALRWLAEQHADGGSFRQAWLTATLMKPNVRPYPDQVARFLSWLFCLIGGKQRYVFGGAPFNAEKFEAEVLADLNSNRRQVAYELEWLQQNRSLRLGSATFGWLRQLFRSIDRLQQPGFIERIRLPVTQFLADDEQVVDNQAARRLHQRLRQGKLLQIAGSKHDLLLEQPAVNAPLWAEIDRALSADP